jgi:hypothetical protein
MSSKRKTAANRRNARKSSGPRSAAGKGVASRNALRHGLAAVTHRQPAAAADLERFANALRGDDHDAILFDQALIIAENHLALRAIGAQQLAVVERLREPSAIALAKGDNRLELCKAQFLKAKQADAELTALCAKLLEQYKDEWPTGVFAEQTTDKLSAAELFEQYEKNLKVLAVLEQPVRFIPLKLLLLLEEKESELNGAVPAEGTANPNRGEPAIEQRDEAAALEEAAADLVRLDRYQRRAWSRQQRAIRAFMAHQVMKAHAPPT